MSDALADQITRMVRGAAGLTARVGAAAAGGTVVLPGGGQPVAPSRWLGPVPAAGTAVVLLLSPEGWTAAAAEGAAPEPAVPFGSITWGAGSLASGLNRVSGAPTGTTVSGGMQISSGLTLLRAPQRGVYMVTGLVGTDSGTNPYRLQAFLGNDTTWLLEGVAVLSQPIAGGSTMRALAAAPMQFEQGAYIGLWATCSVAANFQTGSLRAAWLGPY